MTRHKGPVIIEREDEPPADPAAAPALDDAGEPRLESRALQLAARAAARRPSLATRVFWSAALALLTLVLSVAAWDFVTGLLTRNTVLGGIALALGGLVFVAFLVLLLREGAALARLRKLDTIRRAADAALAAGDLAAARAVAQQVGQLYASRPELRWGRTRIDERSEETFDADALIGLVEQELLAPLDAEARGEVEAAARQVAAITAFVPLALADLITALYANLRMIRRIAEIYGGRAGTLGSWRLTRAVLAHLLATGAIAMGDDLIGSVAGGGLVSKVSRRFGEGLINGALTARVGVAAMDVCRPLPFRARPAPRVTELVRRALSGLFGERG